MGFRSWLRESNVFVANSPNDTLRATEAERFVHAAAILNLLPGSRCREQVPIAT